MHQSYTTDIQTNLIDEPVEILRPVDERCVEFLELKQSIANLGVSNSILVRPLGDRFQLVDGYHRFTIARQLHHSSIAATVKEMTDEEARLYQLTTAINRVEIQPIFIARRIERLLVENPTWTLQDISVRIHKNPYWIKQRLELLFLNDEHQKLVDAQQHLSFVNHYSVVFVQILTGSFVLVFYFFFVISCHVFVSG
jgi:ParB/RepB/Spo0J family partition protein